MGNKLSCSCGQPRKGYKCEDAPMSKQQNQQITGAAHPNLTPQQIALQQQTSHRREGQLLKLWAEVFNVSAAEGGGVCWKRLSEDLVPVNISCLKDTPTSCQFQITAYNTMVDKVLDVRLNQPGTKLGQASECFVYWKSHTGETWGLNFTSSSDARQFKQLCSPQFKIITRKASSSYSIKDQQQQTNKKQQQLIQNQQQQQQQQTSLAKRKPQSTPSSPSTRRREQLAALNQMNSTGHYPPELLANAQQFCTCMADTVLNRQQRNGRNVRYAASSTLPKNYFRQDGRLVAYPSGGQPGNLISASKPIGSAQQQQLPSKPLTSKQIMQNKLLQSGPIRSRPNTQIPMLTKAQLAQQQKIAFQHRAACNSGLTKYTPSTIQICDVRCKSKSSEDVRKSVSTGTEDLLMESRSALTAQNTSHNARRLHPMPATKTTTTIQQSGYQSDHTGGLQPQTRRMQTTGTNTTCSIPNCNLAHRSKMDAFSQHAHPRPTSVPNWNFGTSDDNENVDVRSRPFRSETGRRRSLERTACVDYTDQSPPSDTYMLENLRKMFQQQQNLQTKQITNGNINVTPSTSGDEAIAAIAANLVKQSGNRKAIQQNLNALLGNKLAGKFMNNMALAQQLSKQSSTEQQPSLTNQQQTSTTPSLTKQGSNQQQATTQSTTGNTSPTIKKLQEYETHLRNMLARGNSTELENFSLNTLEALVSQSLENVVSLMREVQTELDAIQLEEQQYRAEQAENQQKTNQQQQQLNQTPDFQSFSQLNKNDKHYWSRSYTLPSRHSLSTSLNINKPQSATGIISPSSRTNLSSMNAGSLGFGLNMSGLLSGTNDLYKEMKKRSSTPFLDAISMDNLAYLTGGLNAGQSFESNDSRANLTWSEVSDEEEIAISDEDGDLLASGRSFAESPFFRQAKLNYNLQCIGAVRKASFLLVKKWILRKPNANGGANIELARKRGWKSYWTCLKGTTLLFYQCDNNGPVSFDSKPKHLIILDGSLVLPLPEHPKKENVFCLSTTFGDAYLFQAPCQMELDSYITQIHCACGASFARHRGKSGTVHLLEEEINKLQKKLESEAKLKHMSELQLSVINDIDSKRSLQSQIRTYEQHLEQYFIEQFRLRSYVTSILDQEQPNPKSLLARISKQTKSLLNKLGVFNVSSLHAHICAGSPSLLNSVMNSGRPSSALRKRQSSGQLSRHSSIGSRPNSRNSATGYGQISTPSNDLIITLQIIYPNSNEESPIPVKISALDTVEDLLYQVCNERQLIPSDHYLQCKRMIDGERYVPHRSEIIKQHHLEVDLWKICQKTLYQVELCRNSLDQLFGFSVEAELVGSSLTAANQSNTQNQQTANTTTNINLDGQVPSSASNTTASQAPTGYDELCVYVSRIEENSLSSQQGIGRGDEIMVINGNIVSELDMMYIESVLQEELSLCMMLRSCRDLSQTDAANQFGLGAELDALAGLQTSDEYIESLVCPPPPSDIMHPFNEIDLSKLIAPPPTNNNGTSPTSRLLKNNINFANTNANQLSSDAFLGQSQDLSGGQWPDNNLSHSQPSFGDFQLLQDNQQSLLDYNYNYGRKLNANLPVDPLLLGTGSLDQVEPLPAEDEPSTELERDAYSISDTERLKKAIRELVDTEKSYVNHLNNLVQLYLEPMQQLNLLSNTEVLTLFYNIQDIIKFQRELLDQINQVLSRYSDYPNFTSQNQFSNLLCDLASVFLSNAERFKLYCKFCANHSKAMKTLYTDCNSNHKLIEFLTTSCKGEHASSLESYLIKPIQRILKYPLLLQQISSSSQPQSVERDQLNCALQAMEDVAYKLNEMQRIHEEYGAIFDHLSRQYFKSTKQQVQLSTSECNHYGEVQWQNIPEFLGKMKKNLDLYAVCFVFKSAVVFLCKEKIRQKKKLVPNTNKFNEVEIIRYQVLMPVNEVQVRATTVKSSSPVLDSETGNATRPLYNWELIHLKCSQSGSTQRRTEKVYQIANATNEERNAFLHHIRQIIRESVRKMALPSKLSSSSSTNSNYQTLHALAKHQLITAVAATGTQLSSIQTSATNKPKLGDLKTNSSTQSNDLNEDKNENKNETTKKTVTISTITKPPAPKPLQKQASSSSGDYPIPPDTKKVPPLPPKRVNLPPESSTTRKPGQKHLSKSSRTFEKQQTIDEKSSPPLGT